MRIAFILVCFFMSSVVNAQSTPKFIDPTGAYKLQAKARMKDGDKYGWFGDIKVKLLDSHRIAMSFYICKGAPGYNSGSFVDTLVYRNNTAIYKDTFDLKKGCTVIFKFQGKFIQLDETAHYNLGTCWGHGVLAFGPYKKYSSRVPEIKDPLVDGE